MDIPAKLYSTCKIFSRTYSKYSTSNYTVEYLLSMIMYRITLIRWLYTFCIKFPLLIMPRGEEISVNLLDVWYLVSCIYSWDFWNSSTLVVLYLNIPLTSAVSTCHCVILLTQLLFLGAYQLLPKERMMPLHGCGCLSLLDVCSFGCCNDCNIRVGMSFWELTYQLLSHKTWQ